MKKPLEIGIDGLVADNERLRNALSEIHRRTGLLMHQNIGRWKMSVEADKRSVTFVLPVDSECTVDSVVEHSESDRSYWLQHPIA